MKGVATKGERMNEKINEKNLVKIKQPRSQHTNLTEKWTAHTEKNERWLSRDIGVV